MAAKEEYQWSFQIKDVVNFEGTEISVYSNTHKGALRKIKSLKLPQLEKMEDMEEGLKLTCVFEVREDLDIEGPGEVKSPEPGEDDET